MNKIKLKLTTEQLKIVNGCFDGVGSKDQPGSTDSMNDRAIFNIAQLLSIRLKKKEVEKEFELKPFLLHFHYYEAYTLYKIIAYQMELWYDTPYEFNVLRRIINELDKKLQ